MQGQWQIDARQDDHRHGGLELIDDETVALGERLYEGRSQGQEAAGTVALLLQREPAVIAVGMMPQEHPGAAQTKLARSLLPRLLELDIDDPRIGDLKDAQESREPPVGAGLVEGQLATWIEKA